jgi:hypothetical protein
MRLRHRPGVLMFMNGVVRSESPRILVMSEPAERAGRTSPVVGVSGQPPIAPDLRRVNRRHVAAAESVGNDSEPHWSNQRLGKRERGSPGECPRVGGNRRQDEARELRRDHLVIRLVAAPARGDALGTPGTRPPVGFLVFGRSAGRRALARTVDADCSHDKCRIATEKCARAMTCLQKSVTYRGL